MKPGWDIVRIPGMTRAEYIGGVTAAVLLALPDARVEWRAGPYGIEVMVRVLELPRSCKAQSSPYMVADLQLRYAGIDLAREASDFLISELSRAARRP